MNELDRPPRDWVLMQSAKNWALRSTCSRAQVGTVLSREGRILASGYNGAPTGMPHCAHGCNCTMAPGVGLVDFVEGDTEHDTWCITRQPCTLAVHAEANALVHAAKYGVGVKGAELHTTRMPCLNCAGLIINAEIKRVVWYEPHRQNDGLLLLEQAGLVVVRYSHD